MKLLPLTSAVGARRSASSWCAASGRTSRCEPPSTISGSSPARSARARSRRPLVGGGEAARARPPCRSACGRARRVRTSSAIGPTFSAPTWSSGTSRKRSSSTTGGMPGQVRARRLARGRQQHPVDPPLHQRADDPQLVLGVVARVAQQQRVAGRRGGALDGGDQLAQVRVAEPADGQPERLRARAGQRAGDRVRRSSRCARSPPRRAARVAALAGRVPLITCETVVTDTPASRATSDIVAICD